MPTRSHNLVLLLAVLGLAVVLTAAVSGAALARSTFQSSPLVPEDTPPVVPSAEEMITATPPPAASEPTLEAPEAPLPAATPSLEEPTAVPPGFLPAPTLTNPDAQLPLPPVAGRPPLVGPALPPAEPSPAPTSAASTVPSAAQLIDNAIVAVSYVWLCCGVALLVLGGAVLVWLVRRGSRR